MVKLNIKPLSVNGAWQGRRFKTPAYKKYENDILFMLPQLKVPEGKLKIVYYFGFSSKLSDLANPEKLITDILCKKYNFDDNRIYEIHMFKEVVEKGSEYIIFEISKLND